MNAVMDFLREWASIAPLLTPLVGLAALGVAWRQLALNRQNQRETTAKATFREFFKLTVQYPKLAEGNYPGDLSQEERSRYQWFVGYFLWAVEEILEFCPKDSDWRLNLQMLANFHGAYFRSPEFTAEEYDTY